MTQITKKNDRLTFFATKKHTEIFFIKNGKIYPFDDLPIDDALMLRYHMEKEDNTIKSLECLGITEPTEQLRAWIIANFPTILKHPDFINGQRITYISGNRKSQLLNDSQI